MEPTLRDGQLVIIRYAAPAQPGQLVVVALPADAAGRPRPWAVKRLTHFEADGAVWVESDNQRAPGRVDSWDLGPLERSAIQAIVVVRLSWVPTVWARRPRSG